ncbi:hypothetical protein AGMMS50249_3120 [candidate division SR1 bacterium]|nr:hypothetical protein AGMMS50249_3120 [candidate division SR1 bacterium]
MQSPLFIDISSDFVYLSCQGQELFLPRNGIENQLGIDLVQRHKNLSFTQVQVLNGPGGFTNLRVGTLCLNLLNALTDNSLDFYTVSKPDLYQFAYDNGDIPRYGVIYIGQKSNIRLRDFQEKIKIGQMSFEQLQNEIIVKKIFKNELFLDITTEREYYPDFLSDCLILNYTDIKTRMDKYLEQFNQQATKQLSANYMIDPTITPSKKCSI